MRTTLLAFVVVGSALLLLGCPAPTGPQVPSCEVDEEAEVDVATAMVDGADWVGDKSLFQSSGTGVMMGFTADAQNQMTIRLLTSAVYSVNEESQIVEIDDGEDAPDLYDSQTDSTYEVGDSDREGADVTLVVDGTTKHSSNADEEGFLSLTFDVDAGTLSGCGWFDAEEQGGGELSTVVDLSFVLTLQ